MVPANFEQLETPCVLVDHARLTGNIVAMQQRANTHQVRLRPHIKTHKSLEIARLQLAEGAVGITASKPDDFLVFINAGVRSVLSRIPIISQSKLNRLLTGATTHQTDLRLVVDSMAGVDALASAAEREKNKNQRFCED